MPILSSYLKIKEKLSNSLQDFHNLAVVISESHSVVSDSLWCYGLYGPWNSPGQNTGVGSLFLLQGIFPTQGSNPGLLYYRQILYQLSHNRSPRILECIAFPFSRRYSWPRNQTRVSCIAGRFFTNWAIREACNLMITSNLSPHPNPTLPLGLLSSQNFTYLRLVLHVVAS